MNIEPVYKDLFGNSVEAKREKTFEEKYQEYINSAAWKCKARAAIDRAGGKCQRCDITKWSVKLSVHHLSYERFKQERPDDLEVLCPECHKGADREREVAVQTKKRQRHWDARLDAWAEKVYGKYWDLDYLNISAIEEHFTEWLEEKERYE